MESEKCCPFFPIQDRIFVVILKTVEELSVGTVGLYPRIEICLLNLLIIWFRVWSKRARGRDEGYGVKYQILYADMGGNPTRKDERRSESRVAFFYIYFRAPKAHSNFGSHLQPHGCRWMRILCSIAALGFWDNFEWKKKVVRKNAAKGVPKNIQSRKQSTMRLGTGLNS